MAKNLPTLYQQFIHKSRYARWLETENRRESWEETVSRYFDFFELHLNKRHDFILTPVLRKELEESVLDLENMPSMRALMTAGPALERCNVGGYNCSYLAIDHPRSFDEIMYILMSGTGVGFSVEIADVSKLPVVNEHFETSGTTITVDDSKAGWSRAYKELIAMLYAGQIPVIDVSKLRLAGARLKTMGGRSSGPDPLVELFNFVITIFQGAAGRRLSPLECHDIVCKTGEVVVVGGVRRSALISLSNLDDREMREAKSGRWWEREGQRALANNSACYTRKPDVTIFMEEFLDLIKSQSGERGIFNRQASDKQAAKNGRRILGKRWGTNPCSEIILRPNQFCNLTEAVVRAEDTLETLKEKVRRATILGTFQSTLTDFKYLRKIWKDNTEEERLLGVSLTGCLDNKWLHNEKDLEALRVVAVETNKEWAEILGIPVSTAITCNKPSGTVSQLIDCASGVHARHSEYYIRTVRGDKKDPLTQFMIDQGIPCEDDVMNPAHTVVFSFPVKAPEGCVTRTEMTAIQHLELWLLYQRHWCEHKPSVTINVKPDEWIDVAAWVYKHFDEVSGVSFLPHSDHTYKQAPYQDCDVDHYNKALSLMPKEIDWTLLPNYEKEDTTNGTRELACVAGICEL
jgi:ribonucleoside-triphosphate reductase